MHPPHSVSIDFHWQTVLQSIEIDRQKEQGKEELLIQQDQKRRKQERETARLEAVRPSRFSRVPAEPAVRASRVSRRRIAVYLVASGKLVRFFSSSDKILSVYGWIGSLAKDPDNFKLCLTPEVTPPCDPAGNCTPYMQVTDELMLFPTVGELH